MQWEGEDGRNVRRIFHDLRQIFSFVSLHQRSDLGISLMSQLSKRERKLNYSVDAYYKETMRTTGPAKPDKAPRVPRAPKQLNL